MRMNPFMIWLKKKYAKVDWQLFIFLLLFLNVKLIVKIAAICFIYFKRFNLSFRFSFRQPALPIFYPVIIAIALLNCMIFSLYKEPNYIWVLITGIVFWIMCILALHQVALTVDQSNTDKIHNTVLLFFVSNALVSFTQLFSIIIEIGEINPYRYQGMYQKYYIGTGDYIRGVTFDTSTTNAIINAFGVVYFLSRKKMLLTLFCMTVLLLTCSNFTDLLLGISLLYLFIFRSSRDQKSIIMVCISFLVIFMTNVSPQNNKYSINTFQNTILRKESTATNNAGPIIEKPDSLLNNEEKKIKTAKLYLDSIATVNSTNTSTVSKKKPGGNIGSLVFTPVIPKINIHAPEYQHRPDSSEARLQAMAFLKKIQKEDSGITRTDTANRKKPLSGKLIAYKQLLSFVEKHSLQLFIGNGAGNFSSKLAFRATGLKIAGGYPAKYTYINEDFKNNHLSVYLSYFGKDSGFHSIINSPNSVYAQLLGEYGLLGITAFLFFYLLYFARSIKKITFGLPLLFIMLGAFFVEYWFEQLSVVVLFELLMLLDIRSMSREEQAI